MQTLGLTTPLNVTEAGTESAVLPQGVVSGEAGAIFNILMTAASVPAAEPLATGEVGLTPAIADPVTKTLATDLAVDMENMIQALSITADVVAKGMAASRAPVNEIILTVEAPSAKTVDPILPELSAFAPAQVQGPTLTISKADVATNIDPAIALLMPAPKAIQIEPSKSVTVDSKTFSLTEADTSLVVQEAAPLQAHLIPTEETYGPWRAEIQGPILDSNNTLITKPVHVAIIEMPQDMSQTTPHDIQQPMPEHTTDVALQVTPEQSTTLPQTMQEEVVLENDHLTPDDSMLVHVVPGHEVIRTVTIHVPILRQTEKAAPDTRTSDVHEETLAPKTDDLEIHADIVMKSADLNFLPQQPILVVVADPKLGQAAVVDQAVAGASTDVLEAPRRAWPGTPTQIPTPALSLTNADTTLRQSNNRSVTGPLFQAHEGELNTPLQILPEQPESVPTKAQFRNPIDASEEITVPDTKVANNVANSSSRSNGNIRDLTKFGVREIEILQGNGSQQATGMTPQIQTQTETSALASNTQAVDGFAPTGTESGNIERRAQAHEVRMRAIERQVISAARAGVDTIRMQLYPPGLGQIIIRMTMDGSKLKLSTRASTSEAADSLRTIEGDLRDALSIGGLELAGFDVSDEGGQSNDRRNDSNPAIKAENHNRSAKPESFALDMNA